MRKALLIGLSTMLIGSVFASEASAQGAPSAGGSCGYQAGSYGIDSLSPIDIRNPNRGAMNLGRWHYQVQYSNVSPGTVLTVVIAPGSPNRGIDLANTPASTRVTAQSTAGSIAGSAAQNENGATRFAARGKGIGGNLASNKGHGKQGGTSSAGQSNSAGLYFFQVWAGGQPIGQFTCAIEDR